MLVSSTAQSEQFVGPPAVFLPSEKSLIVPS